MKLSRVDTMKRKRKNEGKGNFIPKNPIAKVILSAAIIGTPLITTSVAFANTHVSDYLKNWYTNQVSQFEQLLIHNTQSEATVQKANLLRDVREQTEASVKELRQYAREKQIEINKKLKEKAEEIKDEIESEDQIHVEETKKSIDAELQPESTTKTDEHKSEDNSEPGINVNETKKADTNIEHNTQPESKGEDEIDESETETVTEENEENVQP